MEVVAFPRSPPGPGARPRARTFFVCLGSVERDVPATVHQAVL